MKFVVDSLPYYREECPFKDLCTDFGNDNCPRYWGKYFVSSEYNPHECFKLIEFAYCSIEENKSVFTKN